MPCREVTAAYGGVNPLAFWESARTERLRVPEPAKDFLRLLLGRLGVDWVASDTAARFSRSAPNALADRALDTVASLDELRSRVGLPAVDLSSRPDLARRRERRSSPVAPVPGISDLSFEARHAPLRSGPRATRAARSGGRVRPSGVAAGEDAERGFAPLPGGGGPAPGSGEGAAGVLHLDEGSVAYVREAGGHSLVRVGEVPARAGAGGRGPRAPAEAPARPAGRKGRAGEPPAGMSPTHLVEAALDGLRAAGAAIMPAMSEFERLQEAPGVGGAAGGGRRRAPRGRDALRGAQAEAERAERATRLAYEVLVAVQRGPVSRLESSFDQSRNEGVRRFARDRDVSRLLEQTRALGRELWSCAVHARRLAGWRAGEHARGTRGSERGGGGAGPRGAPAPGAALRMHADGVKSTLQRLQALEESLRGAADAASGEPRRGRSRARRSGDGRGSRTGRAGGGGDGREEG